MSPDSAGFEVGQTPDNPPDPCRSHPGIASESVEDPSDSLLDVSEAPNPSWELLKVSESFAAQTLVDLEPLDDRALSSFLGPSSVGPPRKASSSSSSKRSPKENQVS